MIVFDGSLPLPLSPSLSPSLPLSPPLSPSLCLSLSLILSLSLSPSLSCEYTCIHAHHQCTSEFGHPMCVWTSGLINSVLDRIAAKHQGQASMKHINDFNTSGAVIPWSIQRIRGELQQQQPAPAERQEQRIRSGASINKKSHHQQMMVKDFFLTTTPAEYAVIHVHACCMTELWLVFNEQTAYTNGWS